MADQGASDATVSIPSWEPPWPVDSTGSYVRVTSSMLRRRACAEQTARKARPDSFPSGDLPREPAGVSSFPLGAVHESVLALLGTLAEAAGGVDVGGMPQHIRDTVRRVTEDSYQEWPAAALPAIEAGVAGYLEILESLHASGDLPVGRVAKDLVLEADSGGGRVEFWTWAIHHLAADGGQRDVHLLRWADAASSPISESELGCIAKVAADGLVAAPGKWYQRFVPLADALQPPDPLRIVVRVVGVLDGSADVRFDGTPDEARERFASSVPSSLAFLAGGSTHATRACAECNVRYVCPGIPTMPGLLGVAGFAATTRALSPSMLWTHGACPRQLFLARDLGLPRDRQEPSAALQRGTQVHAWLQLAHERGRACAREDVGPWREGSALEEAAPHHALGWTQDEYEAFVPYLRQHVHLCPFRGGVEVVRSEIDVAVWDTDANIVLTTRPDTAYLADDGRWVLRETKTLSPRGLSGDRTHLLERYPQVAVAVCLLADGYRPDTQPGEGPGRVELELLGMGDGEVVTFDASDPLVVLVARTALADRIDAWLFDNDHPVGEHPPCASCEVVRWCTDRPQDAPAPGEGLALPIMATTTDWPAAAPDAVLREAVGATEDDEEFPF